MKKSIYLEGRDHSSKYQWHYETVRKLYIVIWSIEHKRNLKITSQNYLKNDDRVPIEQLRKSENQDVICIAEGVKIYRIR